MFHNKTKKHQCVPAGFRHLIDLDLLVAMIGNDVTLDVLDLDEDVDTVHFQR